MLNPPYTRLFVHCKALAQESNHGAVVPTRSLNDLPISEDDTSSHRCLPHTGRILLFLVEIQNGASSAKPCSLSDT